MRSLKHFLIVATLTSTILSGCSTEVPKYSNNLISIEVDANKYDVLDNMDSTDKKLKIESNNQETSALIRHLSSMGVSSDELLDKIKDKYSELGKVTNIVKDNKDDDRFNISTMTYTITAKDGHLVYVYVKLITNFSDGGVLGIFTVNDESSKQDKNAFKKMFETLEFEE